MLGPEAPRDEGGSSRGLAGAALLQPQPSALSGTARLLPLSALPEGGNLS